MHPILGLLGGGLLLLGAIALVIHIGRRFPSDLDDLRDKYYDYKSRNYPAVLARFQDAERRQRHQERCVIEFRGAVILGVLWWLILLPATLCAFGIGVLILRSAFHGLFGR